MNGVIDGVDEWAQEVDEGDWRLPRGYPWSGCIDR
jgi:hypothetical protein